MRQWKIELIAREMTEEDKAKTIRGLRSVAKHCPEDFTNLVKMISEAWKVNKED